MDGLTPTHKFLVVDTEGSPLLREIAIINDRGEVIYEKRVNNRNKLVKILTEVYPILLNQTVIFHNAEHDIEILRGSYSYENLHLPQFRVLCTWVMTKSLLPKLSSYSLEYLSKHLKLKVNQLQFNRHFAHVARYDALFTFQLYSYLTAMQTNPFTSSRVDNPFQRYVDFSGVYAEEFNQLANLIQEVRSEPNRQSLGAVVLGEAGSGKSHLMMRLAQTHLKTNRLLFISQPNNSESVFYHIYCCVLESLSQQVLDTEYNQLEYLIANTFVRLTQMTEKNDRSGKSQRILFDFDQNPLTMYSRISKEGTDKHRQTWDYIEKKTMEWWGNSYGAGGYGLAVLQGMIKFCRYKDVKKRKIVRRWLAGQPMTEEELGGVSLANWEEELSRENFSLQALKVLGRLSVLDEPLIFVFDQLEGLWLKHHQSLLLSFGHVIKEFITHVPNCLIILNLFPDRWQEFNRSFDPSVTERITSQIKLVRPSEEQLWQILKLRTEGTNIALEDLFDKNERQEILSQPSIRSVLRRASQYFQHKVHKIALPTLETLFTTEPITGSLEERVTKLEKEIEYLKAKSFIPIETESEEPTLEDLFNDEAELSTEKIKEPLNTSLLSSNLAQEIKSYIQQLEHKFNKEYNYSTILSESNDVGKLETIAETFRGDLSISKLKQFEFRNMPNHTLLLWQTKSYAIGFAYGTPSVFANKIKAWNLCLPKMPDTQFILIRDIREPEIRTTAKVGTEEIKNLNDSDNGKFHIMDKTDRVYFELCYNLIVDTQNRDLEAPIESVVEVLTNYIPSYWLVQILAS